MLVALIARDKPGALQIRKDNRPAHVDHLKSSGIVAQAGPLLDAEGEMCGSLVVFEVDDISEVEAWVAADAYTTAGLFESVELVPWNRVIG